MNSVDRVLATVAGKPVDRRPVVPVLSLYGAGLIGCELNTYYTDPGAYVEGQLAVWETFHPDMIFGPFCVAMEGTVFGSEVRFYDNLPPNLIRAGVTNGRQAAAFQVDQLLNHPVVAFFETAVTGLVRAVGQEVPVAPILLSPMDLPAMMMTIEGWLNTLLFDESGTDQVLSLTVPYFVARANRMFDLGVPCLILSGMFVNPSILTRKLAMGRIKPVLMEAFAELNGPVLFHSGGAKLTPFLDLFVDLPRVIGFVVNPHEDLARARELAGPEKVLDGNLDGSNLHKTTPEQVFNDCTALLTDRKDDPWFVLGTSAADIRPETDPACIQAMQAAAAAAGAAP